MRCGRSESGVCSTDGEAMSGERSRPSGRKERGVAALFVLEILNGLDRY